MWTVACCRTSLQNSRNVCIAVELFPSPIPRTRGCQQSWNYKTVVHPFSSRCHSQTLPQTTTSLLPQRQIYYNTVGTQSMGYLCCCHHPDRLQASQVEVARMGTLSIHPASQVGLCSQLQSNKYRGNSRHSFTAVGGRSVQHDGTCGWEMLRPLINQCPATAHSDCPRGCCCFATEAELQRYPKASSASRANCVMSYNFSLGGFLLYSYWQIPAQAS